MTEEHGYNLIHRFLAGEASDAEGRRLETWLETSPGNRQIFDEAEALWRKIDTPQPRNVPSFEAFWQKLESKLETGYASATTIPVTRARQNRPWSRGNYTRWLAAAAILTVLLGAAVIYQRLFKAEAWQTYATQNAERRSVILPDGSHIELNAASQIRVDAAGFDTLRMVTLIGQAFFEVTPEGSGRPFVVRTENAQIRVLGTSFDVRARDARTQVMVHTGRVALRALAAPPESLVVLTGNQMSYVDKLALPLAPLTIESKLIAAWRQRKLVFDHTPLAEIAAELQRVYDVDIKIGDQELQTLAITGTFEQQPVTDILASLCLTLHLKYTRANGKYVISR